MTQALKETHEYNPFNDSISNHVRQTSAQGGEHRCDV